MKFKFTLILIILILCAFLVLITQSIGNKSKNKARLKSKSHSRMHSRSKSHLHLKSKMLSKLKHQRALFANVEKNLGLNTQTDSDENSDNENEIRDTKSEMSRLSTQNKSSQNSQSNLINKSNSSDSEFDMPQEMIIRKRELMKNLPFDQEMRKVGIQLSDWLSITSGSFDNLKKYPGLGGSFIHVDKTFKRINDKFVSPFEKHNIPNPFSFWFKQNLKYIYYFETKECNNALGQIYLDNVMDVRDLPREYGCFSIIERDQNVSYKICAETNFVKRKWLCKLQEICKVEKSIVCGGKKDGGVNNIKQQVKNIIQPMILIPLAAENCNQSWDYLKKGADWQCKCKEGDNQSPIDLPPQYNAIETPASPLFQYTPVFEEAENNAHGGLVIKNKKHRIYFKDGALRIFAESFGKVVTLDGAGYYADEIVFHTPSEHKINGKTLDMEMKIIHKARTEGDFGKMLTLSFLFKRKPGSYNKFLDKLDFYNLPNPLETFMELREDLFIPEIFIDRDDGTEASGEMAPFSFYTYNGSTSEPPCNENTLVYVASDPIKISVATLELFREALKKPDQMNTEGRIINTSKNLTQSNRRHVMPLKGRAVFFHDKKYDCPYSFKKHYDKYNRGHYEKVNKKVEQYFFVDGEKPSMMPGAYVVPDSEAKGKMSNEERNMQEYSHDS